MNKGLLIGGILVVLVLIGGMAVLGMNNSNPAPETEENATVTADQDSQQIPSDNMEDTNKTIVEVASESEDFNTLVTAIQEAGLAETLSGDGPYTVFAPTEEAFAKLPEGTLEAVLADKEKLTAILTYHVVPGKVMAADVVSLSQATTVQGQDLNITVENGTVMVNEAKVVSTDIPASNGVIHVIDTVLLPTE